MTKVYGIIIFGTLTTLLVSFLVVIVLDSYTSKKRKSIYAVIIALMFVLILQNLISYYLTYYVKAVPWRIFVSVLGYSIRPAIIALFIVLFRPDKKHVLPWCMVGFNAIMHTTAFYSVIVFTINDKNVYKGGPLYFLCLAVCLLMFAYLAVLGFLSYKTHKFNVKEFVFHLLWMLIMIAGIVADILWAPHKQWINYTTIAGVIDVVFSYLWLHQRFVTDYETAVLADQRYKAMISQLQPHFIYNALSAISEIEGVPATAQKAISDFSGYLRENLDAMTSPELVSFAKELSHVEKYVALERLRFGDKVNVVYDIRFADFMLPPLTVQMLVENAIKHGITKRYEGGTVTISTKEENGECIITVGDDGVGFDTKAEIAGNHFGIENVRKRLEYSVGGTLQTDSEIGAGCTATITIPMQKEKK